MSDYNLYSHRQRALRASVEDVYEYNRFPPEFKTQVIYILRRSVGAVNYLFPQLVEILCEELGEFRLASINEYSGRNFQEEFETFFLEESDPEPLLDAMELSFRLVDTVVRKRVGARESDKAINQLNDRLKQHSLGYRFEPPNLIRIDSELIHEEVVKPALLFLGLPYLDGARVEFLQAHRHFRESRNKEALTECRKAFESTLKCICHKRQWPYDKETATAQKLIQICLDNKLLPIFWQTNFTSIRVLLESSVPTGGNKLGAHGQGPIPTEVPDHIAAYMLHMTASAIVFLAEAEATLPA